MSDPLSLPRKEHQQGSKQQQAAAELPPVAGKLSPRQTNMGYNLFWGILLFSLYWNIHFFLLKVTHNQGISHHHPFLSKHNQGELHEAAIKQAFLMGTSFGSASFPQQDVGTPVAVPCNRSQELETLVDFSGMEMVLKTAWHTLIRQRTKTTTPFKMITNVVPRKRIRKKDVGEEDFSLTTYATVDNLGSLLETYIRWNGPVSAAVHLTSETEIDTFLSFAHDKGRILKDIAIHVFMEDVVASSTRQQNQTELTGILRYVREVKLLERRR